MAHVQCPSCKRVHRIPDDSVGKWVRCKNCNATFQSQATVVPERAQRAAASARPESPQTPGASSPQPTRVAARPMPTAPAPGPATPPQPQAITATMPQAGEAGPAGSSRKLLVFGGLGAVAAAAIVAALFLWWPGSGSGKPDDEDEEDRRGSGRAPAWVMQHIPAGSGNLSYADWAALRRTDLADSVQGLISIPRDLDIDPDEVDGVLRAFVRTHEHAGVNVLVVRSARDVDVSELATVGPAQERNGRQVHRARSGFTWIAKSAPRTYCISARPEGIAAVLGRVSGELDGPDPAAQKAIEAVSGHQAFGVSQPGGRIRVRSSGVTVGTEVKMTAYTLFDSADHARDIVQRYDARVESGRQRAEGAGEGERARLELLEKMRPRRDGPAVRVEARFDPAEYDEHIPAPDWLLGMVRQSLRGRLGPG